MYVLVGEFLLRGLAMSIFCCWVPFAWTPHFPVPVLKQSTLKWNELTEKDWNQEQKPKKKKKQRTNLFVKRVRMNHGGWSTGKSKPHIRYTFTSSYYPLTWVSQLVKLKSHVYILFNKTNLIVLYYYYFHFVILFFLICYL